jgi:hypothetical protein
MYHPGKAIAIFRPTDRNIVSSDASTQATLMMWDDNILTFLVEPKIAGKIKEKDIVLVDYRPQKDAAAPVPAHTVVKILYGDKGASIWKEYSEMRSQQKKRQVAAQPQQNYIQ